mmetsp:Transcript_18098/g.31402  ORF Transcript_18098/g.31402 Transcript_18098/m.31402 type:complete len:224 (-) Transcript_18098:505-1176(-)
MLAEYGGPAFDGYYRQYIKGEMGSGVVELAGSAEYGNTRNSVLDLLWRDGTSQVRVWDFGLVFANRLGIDVDWLGPFFAIKRPQQVDVLVVGVFIHQKLLRGRFITGVANKPHIHGRNFLSASPLSQEIVIVLRIRNFGEEFDRLRMVLSILKWNGHVFRCWCGSDRIKRRIHTPGMSQSCLVDFKLVGELRHGIKNLGFYRGQIRCFNNFGMTDCNIYIRYP